MKTERNKIKIQYDLFLWKKVLKRYEAAILKIPPGDIVSPSNVGQMRPQLYKIRLKIYRKIPNLVSRSWEHHLI